MSAGITSDVLKRFVRPEEPDLSPEMARHILSFQLSDVERSRLEDLASRCNDGSLTRDEHSEYEALALLGEFLTLMKAKAHLFLKRQTPAA